MNFALSADGVSAWNVTQLVLHGSGTGDEKKHIKPDKVKLLKGKNPIATASYDKNDGEALFFINERIPAGGTVTYSIEYEFEALDCPSCLITDSGDTLTFLEFRTAITAPQDLEATPVEIVDIARSQGAAQEGVVTLSCIQNINTKQYFKRIDDAVNDGSTSDGNTIMVCPGTYIENVDVKEKKDLTIKSYKGSGKTFVEAKQQDDHVFHVKKNGTSIDGFTIRNAGQSEKAGVYIFGSTIEGTKIYNNRFTNNDYGIFANQAKETEIFVNSIQSNKQAGIYLNQSLKSTVSGNSIDMNLGHGVKILNCQEADGDTTRFKLNRIYENKKQGVFIKDSKGVLFFSQKNIEQNDSSGFYLEDSEKIAIEGTDNINKNKVDGIRLKNCKSITLSGNKIEENVENGIHLVECNPVSETELNQIAGNIVQHNKKNGVQIDSSRAVKIDNKNIIGPSNGIGINIEKCQDLTSKITITGNTIQTNKEEGVRISESLYVHVFDNLEISSNHKHGIGLYNCNSEATSEARNAFWGNTIQKNDSAGVYANQCTNLNIAANPSIGPDNRVGIHFNDVWYATITENTIKNNKDAGIFFKNCQGYNDIQYNTIESNTNDGIRLKESGDTSIKNNIFGNTITGSQSGILLDGSINTHIAVGLIGAGVEEKNKNKINHNSFAGIKLLNCDARENTPNTIAYNVIQENPHGIYSEASHNFEILNGNLITTSATAGIYLKESTGTKIRDNTIRFGETDGIAMVDCQCPEKLPNEVTGNTIEIHQRHGIYLTETNGAVIGKEGLPQNELSSNKEDGIHLSNCNNDLGGRSNIIENNNVGFSGAQNKNGIGLNLTNNTIIRKNEIHYNKEHGIFLKSSKYNQIFENVISDNDQDGIHLLESYQNNIPPVSHRSSIHNTIDHNANDGVVLIKSMKNYFGDNTLTGNTNNAISLEASHQNKFLGNYRISDHGGHALFLKGSKHNQIMGPCVAHAKTVGIGFLIWDCKKHGIHLEDSSQVNQIAYLKVRGSEIGCYAENRSIANTILNCNFYRNGTGVYEKDGLPTANFYRGCANAGNYTKNTGFHVDNANPILIGCMVEDNAGNGIMAENGARPVINKSNFSNNDGFALLNNSDMMIQAQKNWWGNIANPLTVISDNVDAANWYSDPVSVVVLTQQDTVYLAKGKVDSVLAMATNLTDTVDVLNIQVNTDYPGWLTSPLQYTMDMTDTSPFEDHLQFQIPAGIENGTECWIRMSATSQTDPTKTDVDSFLVVVYESTLTEIEISPSAITLMPDQEATFTVYGYDENGTPLEVTPEWTATGGIINENGFYSAGSDTGTFYVTAKDLATGIQAMAIVKIDSPLNASDDMGVLIPTEFALKQNYPNPFNPKTTIEFDVKETCHVTLKIYNIQGREVMTLVDGQHMAGFYKATFNPENVASGLYFYRIQMKNFAKVKKMILLD